MNQTILTIATQHAAAMLMRISELVGERGLSIDEAKAKTIKEHMPSFKHAMPGVKETALDIVAGYTWSDLLKEDRQAAISREWEHMVRIGAVKGHAVNRFLFRWTGWTL